MFRCKHNQKLVEELEDVLVATATFLNGKLQTGDYLQVSAEDALELDGALSIYREAHGYDPLLQGFQAALRDYLFSLEYCPRGISQRV